MERKRNKKRIALYVTCGLIISAMVITGIVFLFGDLFLRRNRNVEVDGDIPFAPWVEADYEWQVHGALDSGSEYYGTLSGFILNKNEVIGQIHLTESSIYDTWELLTLQDDKFTRSVRAIEGESQSFTFAGEEGGEDVEVEVYYALDQSTMRLLPHMLTIEDSNLLPNHPFGAEIEREYHMKITDPEGFLTLFETPYLSEEIPKMIAGTSDYAELMYEFKEFNGQTLIMGEEEIQSGYSLVGPSEEALRISNNKIIEGDTASGDIFMASSLNSEVFDVGSKVTHRMAGTTSTLTLKFNNIFTDPFRAISIENSRVFVLEMGGDVKGIIGYNYYEEYSDFSEMYLMTGGNADYVMSLIWSKGYNWAQAVKQAFYDGKYDIAAQLIESYSGGEYGTWDMFHNVKMDINKADLSNTYALLRSLGGRPPAPAGAINAILFMKNFIGTTRLLNAVKTYGHTDPELLVSLVSFVFNDFCAEATLNYLGLMDSYSWPNTIDSNIPKYALGDMSITASQVDNLAKFDATTYYVGY